MGSFGLHRQGIVKMVRGAMELREFESSDVSFYRDFVGFPLLRDELQDLVKYLEYLRRLDRDGMHDQRRMLIQSESGSLFLGRTGTGKTHALHCVVNAARERGYYPVDGSTMLKKERVHPEDIGAFFDDCRAKADDTPLLIAYDDA